MTQTQSAFPPLWLRRAGVVAALVPLPLGMAFVMLRLGGVDLSIPFLYTGSDVIWQLVLSKMAVDTGWILTNPFLGAPGVAHWHNNSAAQASAIHSVIIWALSRFVGDPVATQQVYFLLNFSLISIAASIACRLLRVSTFLSILAGITYAFIGYRHNAVIYAYLANYFAIPLGIVPAIWIATGSFAQGTGWRGLVDVLRSRRFLLSFVLLALVGVSDGYYAFFTLLLLGVAMAMRAVLGDLLRPAALVPPLMLAIALMTLVIGLTSPNRAYQHENPEEFRPNGVPDTVLMKQPSEAEVYSTSIKMLLAPHDRHRIPAMAELGRWMLETSNIARSFKAVVWVPLGSAAALLLLGLFVAMPAMVIGRGVLPSADGPLSKAEPERFGNMAAAMGLALFSLLFSVSGGLGTLVALVYPTIRAYERFPLFLIFFLYLTAALIGTLLWRRASMRRRPWIAASGILVSALTILDNTPHGTIQRDPAIAPYFLAERATVQGMEATLPPGSMVYQFPYSQYLTDNPYYGWGDFRHVRLYLHSQALRWSNGAAKNSWIDRWHAHMATLPPAYLATEMRAVGFRAFVVDRRVVQDEEYGHIRKALTALLGRGPEENEAAFLSWWPMADPGYSLAYNAEFSQAERLTIADPRRAQDLRLPRLVRRAALLQALVGMPADQTAIIDRAAHPEVFLDGAEADLGLGTAPIPAEHLLGGAACGPGMDRPLSVSRDSLTLHINNASNFDWRLNAGKLPLRIGMRELLSPEGARLRWDGGFRAADGSYIPAGQSIDVKVPLIGLDLRTGVPVGQQVVTGVFSLVQDGHRWFTDAAECRVSLLP